MLFRSLKHTHVCVLSLTNSRAHIAFRFLQSTRTSQTTSKTPEQFLEHVLLCQLWGKRMFLQSFLIQEDILKKIHLVSFKSYLRPPPGHLPQSDCVVASRQTDLRQYENPMLLLGRGKNTPTPRQWTAAAGLACRHTPIYFMAVWDCGAFFGACILI